MEEFVTPIGHLLKKKKLEGTTITHKMMQRIEAHPRCRKRESKHTRGAER